MIAALAVGAVVVGLAPASARAADAAPPAARVPAGIYATWYGGREATLDLPGVVGGQAWAQWSQVEPQPGAYDFSLLDSRAAAAARRGLSVTVQVNANIHPDWLFEQVPYVPERLRTVNPRDAGTLMFWHPAYVEAHLRLIDALADWLRRSPHRRHIVAVRLNFNAIGTERLEVPERYRDAAAWRVPPGVAPPPRDGSREVVADYAATVVERYLDALVDVDTLILLRRGLLQTPDTLLGTGPRAERLKARMQQAIRDGRAGVFHTSSEIQPRNDGYGTAAYDTMAEVCRARSAVCFAESWTDAAGRRTEYPATRAPTAGEWFYWRTLSDLSLGVAMLGVPRSDLERHAEPGFQEGLVMAARYAGAQRAPADSPGAWVALREGDFRRGDYGFLATANGCGEGTGATAPSTHPYGPWARRLRPGGTCELRLDETFAGALRKRASPLRLLLIVSPDVSSGRADDTAGASADGAAAADGATLPTLRVAVDDGAWRSVALDAQGAQPGSPPSWQRIVLPLPPLQAADGGVKITVDRAPVLLHLIELRRE